MPTVFIALLIMFFSANVFAQESSHFITGVQGEHLIVEENGVRLHGYRFLNVNGQPNTGKFIVFTHGLHSNLHEFEHLVKEKMAQGYDCYAFNFRGHGNGSEESIVLNYQEGDYGFEKMAREDLPLIMKKVRSLSQQSGHIIGHSMGGMVPRAAVALGLLDTTDIDSFVLIGSPPHFRRQLPLLNSRLAQKLENHLQSGSGDERTGLVDVIASIEDKIDILNTINPFYWMLKANLLFHIELIKNFTHTSGLMDTQWAKRAATQRIPKDIWRSFAGFQKSYDYEHMTIPVPTLYLVGEQDLLVNKNDIEATAKVQSREAGFSLVNLKGVGHLSLVAPQALKFYRDILTDFLMNPKSQANKERFNRKPSLCARWLLGL